MFTYSPPQVTANKTEPMQMLYFGTLSAWQGVDLAVRALALACQDFTTELTVICSANQRQVRAIKDLAHKLGVGKRLNLLEPTSQAALVWYIHQSHCIVAPLTLNDRNVVQGCCPLKVLEGMAAGTPVIASDLPVVRELGSNEEHLLLVKPGSVQQIKDALVRLRQESELGLKLSIAARQRVESCYTWNLAGASLVAAYQQLGVKSL